MIRQRGSSLIEVLVAATVLMVTLVAISGVAMYSIQRAAQARYQDRATQLSNNMMQLFFKERAMLGWYDFYDKMSSSDSFCVNNASDIADVKLTACSTPESLTLEEIVFYRIANVSVDNVNKIVTVEVVTSWDGGRAGTRYNRLVHEFKQIN